MSSIVNTVIQTEGYCSTMLDPNKFPMQNIIVTNESYSSIEEQFDSKEKSSRVFGSQSK